MTDALARARADLEHGRAWKARDRLTGMLAIRRDDELLDLLAQACFEMGDLPAAGALWFVTGRRDDPADQAVAAWRERAGNDEARWSSLPRPLRTAPLRPHLVELREAAGHRHQGRVRAHREELRARSDDAERMTLGEYAACAFALAGVVLAVIGSVTVATWIVS